MNKYKYIAFNKPYGVLTQFTGEPGDKTLADYDLPKEVYAAGRLDKDSEGLLILTNDGVFNQKLTNPKNDKEKTYLVQIEKKPTEADLQKLRDGVIKIKDYFTKKAKVKLVEPTGITDREPPIRERKNIPTAWIELTITEGKNRQVRRMTAAIGYPTLRLIRLSMGDYQMDDLLPGMWKYIEPKEIINKNR